MGQGNRGPYIRKRDGEHGGPGLVHPRRTLGRPSMGHLGYAKLGSWGHFWATLTLVGLATRAGEWTMPEEGKGGSSRVPIGVGPSPAGQGHCSGQFPRGREGEGSRERGRVGCRMPPKACYSFCPLFGQQGKWDAICPQVLRKWQLGEAGTSSPHPFSLVPWYVLLGAVLSLLSTSLYERVHVCTCVCTCVLPLCGLERALVPIYALNCALPDSYASTSLPGLESCWQEVSLTEFSVADIMSSSNPGVGAP